MGLLVKKSETQKFWRALKRRLQNGGKPCYVESYRVFADVFRLRGNGAGEHFSVT